MKTGFTIFAWQGRLRRRYWIEVPCHFCKQPVQTDRGNFRKWGRAYCNKKCKAEAKKPVIGARKFKRGKQGGPILVYLPDHPSSRKGWVLEHRVITERVIGRLLRPDELVHHIDCDPQNNKPTNLIIRSNFQHNLAHASLEPCVKHLLAKGWLHFNGETGRYEVPDMPIDTSKPLKGHLPSRGPSSVTKPVRTTGIIFVQEPGSRTFVPCEVRTGYGKSFAISTGELQSVRARGKKK